MKRVKKLGPVVSLYGYQWEMLDHLIEAVCSVSDDADAKASAFLSDVAARSPWLLKRAEAGKFGPGFEESVYRAIAEARGAS